MEYFYSYLSFENVDPYVHQIASLFGSLKIFFFLLNLKVFDQAD